MQNYLLRKGREACSRLGAIVRKSLPVAIVMAGHCITKAQTEESDFKFKEGVRYSQWVINSRINNFNANTTPVGFAVYNDNGNQTKGRIDGKATLDYVPGLVAKGIIEAALYYSQYDWAQSWANPWYLSIKNYGDYFCDKYASLGGSLDDLNAAKLYLPLRELTAPGGKYSNTTTYNNTKTALDNAITGLYNHNRNCIIESGTVAQEEGYNVTGGWWHKTAYNNQMWLDGQYMGGVLLAQLINYKGTGGNVIDANDWNIAVKQLEIVWNMCWNSEDQLMYHAFDANAGDKNQSDSHSETWAGLSSKVGKAKYLSSTYWARACGWYFLALVDMLEEMNKAGITNTDERYIKIKGYLDSLAAGLNRWQDKTTGGWYQILNEKGDFIASDYKNYNKTTNPHKPTSNYIESSATAIFAAAYLKAIRLGYLSRDTYETTAKNAYQCIVNNFFAADGDGIHIFGSCRSAGLGNKGNTALEGNTKYRNGSKEYYLLGSDVSRVAKSENITEGKVLGAFILAATEYERQYQADKEILFEKDLAPSYDLTTGKTTTISIKASGSGTPAYQWYNEDGTKVEGATSSTFSPTISGKYYCKAISGNTEITSSVTEVTVTTLEDLEKDKIEGETEVNKIVTGGGTPIVWTFTNKQDGLGTTDKDVTFTSIDGSNTIMTYKSGSGDGIISSDKNTDYSNYLKINGKATTSGRRWMKFNAPSEKGTITIVFAGTAEGKGISIYDQTAKKELTSIVPEANSSVTSKEVTTTTGNTICIYDTTGKNYIYSVIWTPVGETGSSSTIYKYTYRVKTNYKTPIPSNSIRRIEDVNDNNKTLVSMTFGSWKHNNGNYDTTENGNITDAWISATEKGTGIDEFNVCFAGKNSAKDEIKGTFKENYPFTLPVRGAFMTMEPTKNGKLLTYVTHTGDFYITDQRGIVLQSVKSGTEDVVKYEFDVKAGETYYLFSNNSAMGFCGASFIPGDAQPANNITLGETTPYTAPGEATDYAAIDIKRTLKAGQWNTLTLPFNMTESEVESTFGNGTQLIILDKAEINGSAANLHFIYHERQNILAGYPYLIKPTKTEDISSFTVSNKWIDPMIAQTEINCGDYTAKGTPEYSTATVTNETNNTSGYSVTYKEGDIFMSDGNGKLYVSAGKSYGKGYRSYIEKNNNGKAAAKSITMSFTGVEDNNEHGTTTSIDFTELSHDALPEIKAGGVYNLNGQRVAETTSGLPKGIYIANGKKIIIK